MGDSYSAGNGAGSYYGASGCYRSRHNYAEEFASIIRAAPYRQPATVTTVACSGAVTADFSKPRSGRPPQLDAVNNTYDLIFLTIGGNDAYFADIVENCLIAQTRDGASCASSLKRAESLVSRGVIASRTTAVLRDIENRASSTAKIILLGYPYLEGDPKYTLRSGSGSKAPIIDVGHRLHVLGDEADQLDRSVVSSLNLGLRRRQFVAQSVQKLFDGPPFHGLYAQKNNPNRWMIAPFVDASIAKSSTWYHPNPTGWKEEASQLFKNPAVPKVPRGTSRGGGHPGAS